jgi:hypothetical protein
MADGRFHFKWVDAGALPFDQAQHVADDLDLFKINISQSEGDFASLEIEVINPHVGLLAPGRKQWGWLSYERNGSIVPLFYGRIVGVPEDLEAETLLLNFIARPVDFVDQKEAYANSLKVAPYWDPIWFTDDNRDDPDNVLESRPELWHIDPVTHEVSTSNILIGEDGLIELGEDDMFYDDTHINYGSAPLRSVTVKANVAWPQQAAGGLDLQGSLPNSIKSFTGKSLIENWPEAGTSLSGGWSVLESGAVAIGGSLAPAVYGYYDYLARMAPEFYSAIVPPWAGDFDFNGSGGGSGVTYHAPAHVLRIPLVYVRPTLVLGYETSRNRTEGITFTLSADTQAILTDPGDDDALVLTFQSSELGNPIDLPGDDSGVPLMPIRDLRSAVYFSTDRGAVSIEYLITVARARLLARARTVNVDIAIAFDKAIDEGISLRKSAFLRDYRLPGGEAAGKITEWSLSVDGDSGELLCEMTVACSVGQGSTIEAQPGVPSYVDDGYVDPGYQYVANEIVMPIAGEIGYGSINGLGATADDGLDLFRLTADRVVKSVVISGTELQQRAAMDLSSREDTGSVFDALNEVGTTVTLTLQPLTGGPFDTQFGILTTPLSVPKTIDLEGELVS